ncbi:MAG: Hsp20 family protein [Atopobiaceae bacterium]|jgi:HSP20 family protein|nr:Hsp20 family protein [Atopobiaceae bacterium]MCH4119849.1 Hsp20 family protein [Atopobiaceae bacterium]MCI1317741.1 Hsp20 family protein [Atopobiaceae bacterium]MCI1389130.1 Hsp20 family protein [Atopobiaceae bacterium]MCI1432859.1 Hsp20 family protein [Atopobiaceae bacterium]
MASILPYGFGRNLTRWPFDDFFEPLSTVAESDAFAMDVEDAGDSYVVTAELPGVTRDQIDVELNEGRLSIAVDKKESQETKDKNYLHKETGEWKATRGVYLKDAATSGLSAKLDGGVLTVNVPKQQEKANVTKVVID